MRGSNWLVWSISACAVLGTAESSGDLQPRLGEDGIGQLVVLGRAGDGGQLLVQQLQALFRYWLLFGLIAGGRACACLSAANLSAGSR